MGFVIGLFVNAAIIGVIIAILEKGEFPGWGPTIGSAFAISATTAVAGHFLPGLLVLLAPLAGAAVGAFAIAHLCDMTYKRSLLAAGIYLAVGTLLSLVMSFLLAPV